MRELVASLLVVCGFASVATALQSGAAPARACAVLTRELVVQVSPHEKQALDLVLRVPPREDTVGKTGSSCSFGGIELQIDPFVSPGAIEKEFQNKWSPVPGLGDVAYYRDNLREWGELYVRSNGRVVTIQMDIPMGRTAESIKPNTVELAKAVLSRLK